MSLALGAALAAFFGRGVLADMASTFVWQPSGVTGNGIYATMAELEAAVKAVNGLRFIVLDDSLTPGATVWPAGAWNFNPTGISGDVYLVSRNAATGSGGGFQTAVATASASVTIAGLSGLRDVYIVNNSTVDLVTITANYKFTLDGYAACYQGSSPSGAWFKRTGGTFVLDMAGNSIVSTFGGAQEAVQIVGGASSFVLKQRDAANFGSNKLLLSGGATAAVTQEGPNCVYAAQAGATTVPTGGMKKGTTTLSSGVSPTLTLTGLAAGSSIEAFYRTPSGSTLTSKLAALNADRTVGAQGTFKISALKADESVNTADGSTVDWIAFA